MLEPDGLGLSALVGEPPCARCPYRPALPGANTVPAWVLPMMRLLRERGTLARAWAALPANLPPGVAMPGEEEAAVALLRLGLV